MLESTGAVEFAYTHFRTLDPVRAAALTAAVNHFIYGLTTDTDPSKS